MSRPMSRILFPLRGGDHPSGPPIAGRLKQLPSDWAGSLHPTTSALRRGLLPCSRWGLPGHLRHRRCRCALTAPFHPDLVAEAVYFLLHFPADRSGLLLATTVPCGVRTFLDPRLPVQRWFAVPRPPGRLIREVQHTLSAGPNGTAGHRSRMLTPGCLSLESVAEHFSRPLEE